jgi:hypothetical protein
MQFVLPNLTNTFLKSMIYSCLKLPPLNIKLYSFYITILSFIKNPAKTKCVLYDTKTGTIDIIVNINLIALLKFHITHILILLL